MLLLRRNYRDFVKENWNGLHVKGCGCYILMEKFKGIENGLWSGRKSTISSDENE